MRWFAALLCVAALGEPAKLRYVNPLSIEDTRSIADPTAMKFRGQYYLFLSGGVLWTSSDLVHWKHERVTLPPPRRATAPHAFEFNGSVYLTGNDVGLYRAAEPKGPYEYIGDFKDEQGNKILLFDTMIFVDDDQRVYCYYSGRHANGIYGVELDGKDLTKFAGAPKRLWTFEKSHVWERYGDNNEGTELSWIEAPWMTKHKGTYYLQYAAPGTEWKTYAVGVYTSRKPLGPFTYAQRNPILVHKNGLINGTGHHSVVEGPDGNLWAFYTILYRNWSVFDRRVGMDPVGFDARGNMYIDGPSETPQFGPGAAAKPWLYNDSGSIAVSINRYTWSASSQRPGRDAMYAFDNNVRTWWEPEDSDAQPWIVLDLGCRNPTDANQEFDVDSVRLMLDHVPRAGAKDLRMEGHGRWYQGSARAAVGAYQYKLETSLDNKSFRVVVDETANRRANNVLFEEFAPVRARYVRLTVTGRPKGGPMGVLEFTVFGKSHEGIGRKGQ